MAGEVKWMGRRSRATRVMALLVVILASAAVAIAQLPTATLLGVVKDASGAVVPGASLTARRNLQYSQPGQLFKAP